ncbi:MAG: hypothetical protein IT423_02590 [Pirellulaceae bacterium]|nr:hypothetical protein [Pirellulaceae bacterium]
MQTVVSYRPDLPDYGAYLRWPVAGTDWIHPDDIALAESLIPSARVFRRLQYDGQYYHVQYGTVMLRVRPTMWTQMPVCDVQVGDRVEIISRFGQQDPGIAIVADVLANRSADNYEFRLQRGEMSLPQLFVREQFQLLTLRYRLRSGYYIHQPARFAPPADMVMLNVGDLSHES